MARKKGKDRDSRVALLDAAWELLLERGAGGMSVDAIAARAKLSKGTFFHFFPAKQDLLDALCARIAETSWQRVGGALERADLDPVERFDLLLHEARAWRFDHAKGVGGLWRELARDENAALLGKVRAFSMARLAPAAEAILREGARRRRMRVEDAPVVAALAVEWMFATVEGSLKVLAARTDARGVDLVRRRANATLTAMEKVLGIKAGSLRRVDRAVVSRIAEGVAGIEEEAPARKGGSSHGRSQRTRPGNRKRR